MKHYKEPLSMIPCSDCSIGQMRQTSVTWFTFVEDRMITVPDFPVWICDMCGKCEYDLNALDNLATLLCPQDAARPARAKRRPAAKSKAAPADLRPLPEE